MKIHIAENKKDPILLIYLILLLIPALFINLGMMPFILDEATRANVALEMIFSGDFFHPTINGEYYFNKPPLFNWIQILSLKISQGYNEFGFRLPVVLSLLLFGLSIYTTQKKEFGRTVALLTALAVITSGRIFFYDSFKGLIDISFSWIIYLMFWSIYYFGKQNKFLLLFLSSYFFASIAFMMKGLPALVFLGITLLLWFIAQKKFWKLFSIQHFIGFMLLVLITGSYFYMYNLKNPASNYLDVLWSESSKRTFIDSSLWDSFKHIVYFPFQFIYYFAPWTILIVLLFWKRNRKLVIENPMSKYFSLCFLANILVYWFSPAIYARYLFMFLPLLFSVLFYVLVRGKNQKIEKFIIKPFMLFVSGLIVIIILIIPFFVEKDYYENLKVSYSILLVLILLMAFLIRKNLNNYILIGVATLLIARISFNLFVFPHRINVESYRTQKNGAIMTGILSKGSNLFIMPDTRIQHATSFYIMKEREETLRYSDGTINPNALYIIEKEKRGDYAPHKIINEFETRIEGIKLLLVRFD